MQITSVHRPRSVCGVIIMTAINNLLRSPNLFQKNSTDISSRNWVVALKSFVYGGFVDSVAFNISPHVVPRYGILFFPSLAV